MALRGDRESRLEALLYNYRPTGGADREVRLRLARWPRRRTRVRVALIDADHPVSASGRVPRPIRDEQLTPSDLKRLTFGLPADSLAYLRLEAYCDAPRPEDRQR
ncbi:MAG: hypothetical protein KAX78_05790 [Phycisphaerae bacterium]|nr:hypothetical protein [Phycisphaerae bacterium]